MHEHILQPRRVAVQGDYRLDATQRQPLSCEHVAKNQVFTRPHVGEATHPIERTSPTQQRRRRQHARTSGPAVGVFELQEMAQPRNHHSSTRTYTRPDSIEVVSLGEFYHLVDCSRAQRYISIDKQQPLCVPGTLAAEIARTPRAQASLGLEQLDTVEAPGQLRAIVTWRSHDDDAFYAVTVVKRKRL